MNLDSTIEKITREVLSKLQTTGGGIVNSSYNGKNNILIIITGSDWKIDSVMSYINSLYSNNSLTFLFSKSAEKIIGTAKFQSAYPNAKFLYDGENYRAKEIVQNFDLIIAPTMTLTTISKIANLIGDNLITNVIIQSILNNKAVIATKDTLIHDGKIAPESFQNIISKYINIISTFGVIVVNVTDLQTLNLTSIINSGSKGAGDSFYSTIMEQCSAGQLDCSACGLCVVRTPEKVRQIVDAGASRISSSLGVDNVSVDLAGYIDHTLLKPDVKENQIIKLCDEARKYHFVSVCVNPGWVKLAAQQLQGSGVKVCTVIGFPLGATSTETKVAETYNAIKDGATEIDMVINVGALKSQKFDFVEQDIRRVKDACGSIILKVIIETCLLNDDEKIKACELSKRAKADFVKTSTGFGTGGATAGDIALMRAVVGPDMGVKASGGIRDAKTAKEMIRMGATRIGVSASVAIVKGETGSSDY
jgi:deoxyribose-phosphate aldolase